MDSNVEAGLKSPDGTWDMFYKHSNKFGQLINNKTGEKFELGGYIDSEFIEDPACVQWITKDTLILKTSREVRLIDFKLKEMACFSPVDGDYVFLVR